jgi:FkbM family methyltransferase
MTFLIKFIVTVVNKFEGVLDYVMSFILRNLTRLENLINSLLSFLIKTSGRKFCLDKEIVVDTNYNFKMSVSPHDFLGYGIYFYGEYDSIMSKIFTTLIRPGQTVWDLGAERGWFSLLAGKIVGPTGRVDSFEAYYPNFKKLKGNISLNKMNWIKPVNLAIGQTVGKSWFRPPSDEITNKIKFLNSCDGVGYVSKEKFEDTIEITTTTLDAYAKTSKLKTLSLIKIDIEGSEYEALLKGKNVIKKFKPIIVIEYNRNTSTRAGNTMEKVDKLLSDYGYDRFVYDDVYIPIKYRKDGTIDYEYDIFNVFCFPKYNI